MIKDPPYSSGNKVSEDLQGLPQVTQLAGPESGSRMLIYKPIESNRHHINYAIQSLQPQALMVLSTHNGRAERKGASHTSFPGKAHKRTQKRTAELMLPRWESLQGLPFHSAVFKKVY